MPQFNVNPSRIRTQFNGQVIADSTNALILIDRSPVYFFPKVDVKMEYLTPTDHKTGGKVGEATYWTVSVDGESAENAAYAYTSLKEASDFDITDYITFKWKAMEAWYEESEQIFGHPRNPYHRVDVRHSDRHVQVEIDGVTVADSTHAVFLFETGIRPRYYIPQEDIRMDLLTPTDTETICPYKGFSSYWSADINGNIYNDIVWGYADPHPESAPIRDMLSFYNEKVQVYIDGVLEES